MLLIETAPPTVKQQQKKPGIRMKKITAASPRVMQNEHGWHAFPRNPRTHSRRQRHCGCHRVVPAAEKSRRQLHRPLPVFTRKRPPVSTSIRINKFSTASAATRAATFSPSSRNYENIGLHGRCPPAGRTRQNSPRIRSDSWRTAIAPPQRPVAQVHEANRPALAELPAQRSRRPDARDYLTKRGVSPEAVETLFASAPRPTHGTTP